MRRTGDHGWSPRACAQQGLRIFQESPARRASRLVAEARKLGVRIHALGVHYTRRPVKRGLLFGYGAIEENDIGEGLTRLRRALHLVNARL